MTWDHILWHSAQAFFAVLCVCLFFEQGRLRNLVNYLISQRNDFNLRCNMLEDHVAKLTQTFSTVSRPEGTYRDNAASDSRKEGDEDEEDIKRNPGPPFVPGQAVEVSFKSDDHGTVFVATFVSVSYKNFVPAVNLKMDGDKIEQFPMKKIYLFHPEPHVET